ncbi:hypothetical protein GYMLUDRAFT_35537 [Collybiopsis luxurians FD-317 M1]|nr:hypothetical protein GYMLUDRAFT_35537 [Collybiopsis luxurians FD-317 M1]
METRLGSSVLGLLITGFDVAATRKKELEYVWAKPFRLTFVRFLFILARYMALLIHIIDISLTSVVTATFLRTKQAPERSCTMLVVFHTVSLNIMLLVLHSILMIRVFALYDRSFRMGVFLLILLVGGFAGSTVGILHALRQYPILGEFNETCLDLKALEKRSIQNPLLVFVSTGELCFQFILHGLAFKRTAWDLPRVLFSRPALLSVLNRDGLKIFISMLVAMIAGSVAVLKKRKLVGFLFPSASDDADFCFGNKNNPQPSEPTYFP